MNMNITVADVDAFVIDAEGMDDDILDMLFAFEDFAPAMLQWEHQSWLTPTITKLLERGYVVQCLCDDCIAGLPESKSALKIYMLGAMDFFYGVVVSLVLGWRYEPLFLP